MTGPAVYPSIPGEQVGCGQVGRCAESREGFQDEELFKLSTQELIRSSTARCRAEDKGGMKGVKEGGVDGRQGGARGHTEGTADLALKNQATAPRRECLMPRPPPSDRNQCSRLGADPPTCVSERITTLRGDQRAFIPPKQKPRPRDVNCCPKSHSLGSGQRRDVKPGLTFSGF